MESLEPNYLLIIGVLLGALITWILSRSQIGELKDRLRVKETESSTLNEENRVLGQEKIRLETELVSEKERSEEKQSIFEDAEKKLSDAFKALSSDALKSNNQSFIELAKAKLEQFQEGAKGDLEQRQKAIDQMVKPIRESIDKVDVKIQNLEKVREGAYAGLTEKINNLLTSEDKLQKETANLVSALRKPSVRGSWGEIQLRQAVEFAGMVEHCDFLEQESVTVGDGRFQRPDMIIKLPNGRNIVVDAKTPMEAYLQSLESKSEDDRLINLKSHARQLRDKVKDLSMKKYWEQFTPTPEFVILFLPNEALFSAALEQDGGLINYGAENHVIIATPTTLIALLLAVAYGWQQDTVAEHARQISDLGRDLYERMGVLADHFSALGKNLDRTVDAYNKAVRSTESRLLVSARKFKELGSGSEREIELLETIDHDTALAQSEELSQEDDKTAAL